MAKTFAQLYNDAIQQIDEKTGNNSVQARSIVQSGINEAYADFASVKNWDELSNNVILTLSANTEEYTPVTHSSTVCRIRAIDSVIDQTSNRYLAKVTREEFEKSYPYVNPQTDIGEPTLWYESGYDSNRDIKFKVYTVPDSDLTVKVTFYEEPLELASDGDIPRIPDQWHTGLTFLGIAKYYEFQHDPMSVYYRQMHETYIAKMLDAQAQSTTGMPVFNELGLQKGFIAGKLGRIYND